jgi:two-component system, NarL family, nitrate/nitrite response regulator NarL
VLEGMKAILATMDCMEVAATASKAEEAMAVLSNTDIDLAFVDINLPGINGIELTAKIKREFPGVQVIGLSTFQQRSYVSQMIASGASGYLVKSAAKQEIENAIATVLEGRMYFGTDIIASPVPADDEVPTLTRREKEILKLVAEGKTSNEMAEKLFLSVYTVDTHRKNLLTKFKVNNTATLISKAAAAGLLGE